MDSKLPVILSADLIERCDQYGIDLVAHYSGGGSPNSAAVSSRGAERNVDLQSMGKQAEVVFCIEHELDPLTAIRWDCSTPDLGWDVQYGRAKVDVKYTGIRGRRLIWPTNKASFIASKTFDALVLVQMKERGIGSTIGWMSKAKFIATAATAKDGDGTGLDVGTLYVDRNDLKPVPTPREALKALARKAIAEKKQFEFITGKHPYPYG